MTMEGLSSCCELCGSIGHTPATCKYVPTAGNVLHVDFDEAGASHLRKLEECHAGQTVRYLSSDFAGLDLLRRLERPVEKAAAGEARIAAVREWRGAGIEQSLDDETCGVMTKVPGLWALNRIWKCAEGEGEVHKGGQPDYLINRSRLILGRSTWEGCKQQRTHGCSKRTVSRMW